MGVRLSCRWRSVQSTGVSNAEFLNFLKGFLGFHCRLSVLLSRSSSDYRGSLYSVVAIVHKLRSLQSVADFVVMVQVSATTTATTLTPLEEEVFNKLNVTVVYLPKQPLPEMETFYSMVVQGKFYILNLVQYSRVMFLDVDIWPRCNLDYLFALSESDGSVLNAPQSNNLTRKRLSAPLLKENIVMGWKHEPSNAGMFVLKPQFGAYDNILQPIIDQKESQAWDPMKGWGHVIGNRFDQTTPADDVWVAPSGIKGTNWTWAYAFADQVRGVWFSRSSIAAAGPTINILQLSSTGPSVPLDQIHTKIGFVDYTWKSRELGNNSMLNS